MTQQTLRNGISAQGRFHTNVRTVIFSEPVTQLMQSFGKGRKASLLIFGTAVGICDADTGKDPGFVDIKSTAVFTNNLKRQKNNLLRFIAIS